MVKVDFLKQKTKAFLTDVKYDITRKEWSLAEVLRELEKVYPKAKRKIRKIQKEKASTIGDLDQAHITFKVSAC